MNLTKLTHDLDVFLQMILRDEDPVYAIKEEARSLQARLREYVTAVAMRAKSDVLLELVVSAHNKARTDPRLKVLFDYTYAADYDPEKEAKTSDEIDGDLIRIVRAPEASLKDAVESFVWSCAALYAVHGAKMIPDIANALFLGPTFGTPPPPRPHLTLEMADAVEDELERKRVRSREYHHRKKLQIATNPDESTDDDEYDED